MEYIRYQAAHRRKGPADIGNKVIEDLIRWLVIIERHGSLNNQSEQEADLFRGHELEIARAVCSDEGDHKSALADIEVARTENFSFSKLNPL